MGHRGRFLLSHSVKYVKMIRYFIKEKPMKEKKITAKIVAAVVIVLALIAGFLCIYMLNRPKSTPGAKSVTVEIVDNNQESTTYLVNTDAEYARQALEEIEDLSIEGDESEYGLMITTINGLYADYEADGAYWAFYVNGEYANYGVDSQPIADGDILSLKYTVYEAE